MAATQQQTIWFLVKGDTSNATKAFQRLGNTMANTAKKASAFGKLMDSLKRIAFYRAIRGVIRSITQAFSEGLEKAYIFSNGIVGEGHRFAEAMDRMTSASVTMKGQLGSAFISLLTAIEPILVKIINLITKVADAISQLLAAFTGRTYIRSLSNSATFADTMKSGAKAAKEWKNQLMGFDVINRLEEPSKSGGSSSDPLDGYRFVETPIDSSYLAIVQKFRDLINSIDFTPLEQAFERLKTSVGKFVDIVRSGLAWAWENVLVPLAHWFLEEAAPAGVDALASAFEFLASVLEWLKPYAQYIWEEWLKPLGKWTGSAIIKALKDIGGLFHELADWVGGKIDFDTFWEDLDALQAVLFLGAVALGAFTHPWITLGLVVVTNVKKIKEWWEALKKSWDDHMEPLRGKIEQLRQTHGDAAANIAYAIETVVWALQKLCGWIQSAIDGFVALFSMEGGGSHSNFAGWSADVRNITGRASGGYVPSGELFVAREAGPELVGSIGGRTAVANNDQIIEGIKEGVYEAVTAAMSGGGGNGQPVCIYLDGREIARTTTKYQNQMARAGAY